MQLSKEGSSLDYINVCMHLFVFSHIHMEPSREVIVFTKLHKREHKCHVRVWYIHIRTHASPLTTCQDLHAHEGTHT